MEPLKTTKNSRPLRLSLFHLEDIFIKCGWDLHVVQDNDFPFDTKYFKLVPRETHRLFNSDDIRTLLYGFGYFNINVDYKEKIIIVYVD